MVGLRPESAEWTGLLRWQSLKAERKGFHTNPEQLSRHNTEIDGASAKKPSRRFGVMEQNGSPNKDFYYGDKGIAAFFAMGRVKLIYPKLPTPTWEPSRRHLVRGQNRSKAASLSPRSRPWMFHCIEGIRFRKVCVVLFPISHIYYSPA